MSQRIIFIHGRSFKPARPALRKLWIAATRQGIARSAPDKLTTFDRAHKVFVYYGELSNAFLRSRGKHYDEAADLRDRKACLRQLSSFREQDFTKEHYEALPGQSSLMELLADLASGPLYGLGLSERAITTVAPDLCEYWNPDASFGSELRWSFSEALRRALNAQDEILVVAHSLGTMIAWDTFWKFSYAGEYRHLRDRYVALWITLGSPLGDSTVKAQLKGAQATGPRRFPTNITRWENVAAVDDYISHDEELANDYHEMLDSGGALERLQDHRIYNLAIRHGRSNPHSSVGYLIHPIVSRLISGWLRTTPSPHEGRRSAFRDDKDPSHLDGSSTRI